jgi:hypothetical protein
VGAPAKRRERGDEWKRHDRPRRRRRGSTALDPARGVRPDRLVARGLERPFSTETRSLALWRCRTRDLFDLQEYLDGVSEHASPPLDAGALWRRPVRVLLRWLWKRLPRRVQHYFAARFAGVTRTEATGYAVWAAMGVAIGIPEVWAAAAGSDFFWPTISTTVGHLQDRWPVLTLIPVTLIVMGAYSVYRLGAAQLTVQADLRTIARTPQGRLTKRDVPLDEVAAGFPTVLAGRQWNVLPYFLVATVAVVATALIASVSDNRFLVGYVLYSLIAFVWVIVPNVAAYWFKRDVPFTTLFFTIQCLGRRLQLVAAFVAALLVILLLHLAFYPWPSHP